MGIDESPKRKKRRRRARKREEGRWAAKAGPVTVRYIDPVKYPNACPGCGGPKMLGGGAVHYSADCSELA
jgi:hypothetical protein